jgi:acetylornithine deacetylase
VDPLDLIALTRSLVDIDSTTGREADCGAWLAAYLRYLGWQVDEQDVGSGRANVIASLEPPKVVFSTHFDCVPAFFPSRIEGDRLHGRGTCDAKGTLAAQVHAAEQLRASGERRVGLVFVVGEERGSDGAKAANTHPLAAGCRYLVNGEPTSSQLGTAHRGVLRIRMIAAGRAAHTSRPELGESAIDKLIDALVDLRAQPLPEDPLLGKTYYTIGLISGGDALRGRVAVETILEVPAVRLATVAGFKTASFPFTTDIPFLDRWGQPLLFGPGSILQAHTADEHVEIDELTRAVDSYVGIARKLLQSEVRLKPDTTSL